jgi:hypothetical protein
VLQEPPGGITTALLTGVFTQSFETYDQVTFEFQEGMPGFRIEYVEPPIIADASGLEVEIAGSAFLQVRMERAAGHDPDTGEETYTGSLELTPGIPQVVELERTGDFEGVLTWVLGVNERADFRVQNRGRAAEAGGGGGASRHRGKLEERYDHAGHLQVHRRPQRRVDRRPDRAVQPPFRQREGRGDKGDSGVGLGAPPFARLRGAGH